MSKRLQVLLDEAELRELRRIARRRRMTVAAWVRQALSAAARVEGTGREAQKLAAVRHAATHAFPAGPIDDMLAEIERGYTDRAGRR